MLVRYCLKNIKMNTQAYLEFNDENVDILQSQTNSSVSERFINFAIV